MVNMDFLIFFLFVIHPRTRRYHLVVRFMMEAMGGGGGGERNQTNILRTYMLKDNCEQQKPYVRMKYRFVVAGKKLQQRKLELMKRHTILH